MAYELNLEFAPGFPADLTGASELRALALTRIRAAKLIIQSDESTEGVFGLLMDCEGLLNAADARDRGEDVELSGEGRNPDLQSLVGHARALRYAISGCRDQLYEDAGVLDELAYGLEQGLAPRAEVERRKSAEFLGRYADRVRARENGEEVPV